MLDGEYVFRINILSKVNGFLFPYGKGMGVEFGNVKHYVRLL